MRRRFLPFLSVICCLGLPILADHEPPPYVVENVPLDIPWAGRTVAVDVSPAADTHWLAASETGGLFETTDSGLTWTRIDSLPPHYLWDVAFAPNSASTILVTAAPDYRFPSSSGIWRSTDGGATWNQRDPVPLPACHTGWTARGIAFDPNPSNTRVYVATDCGVAVSLDNGATFSHNVPPGTSRAQEHAIAVHPDGAITTCGEDGLHYSTDGGTSWSTGYDPREPARQEEEVCPPKGNIAVAASPVENDVAYVSVRERDDSDPVKWTAKLYEVDFSGPIFMSTRMDTPEKNNRPPFVRIGSAPGGPPTAYDVYYSNGVRTYRQQCDSASGRCSSSTGAWSERSLVHADASDIAFSRTTGCPLVMSNDGGVLTSIDCGDSWQTPAPTWNGLNALQIYDVEVQSYGDGTGGHDHTDIYISTQDNWVWGSSDGGLTWPHEPNSGEGLHIEVPRTPPPHDEQIISYTACTPCGGKVTEEHLANKVDWTPPTIGVPVSGFPGQLVIEHDTFISVMNHRVCTGTTIPCQDDGWCLAPNTCDNVNDYRIHVLEGLGSLWTSRAALTRRPRNALVQFSGPLANPVTYIPVVSSPMTEDRWSRGFGLVRIDNLRSGMSMVGSADGRRNSAAPPNNDFSLGTFGQGQACFDCPKPAYAVHPTVPSELIGVGADGQIYRSTTSGVPDGTTDGWILDAPSTTAITAGYRLTKDTTRSWFNTLREEPNIRVIEYDPADPTNILVGLETGGVFFSDDSGTSWEKIPGSEQILAVTAFAFDQITRDVYVSSYGRGLWRLRRVDLMLPSPDAFEPNDTVPAAFLYDPHRHYDPRVAEDYSAVLSSLELWSATINGSLHDRDDIDRFAVGINDVAAHVPDLPDGPTPVDPMPVCGSITRLTAPLPFYPIDAPDTIMFTGSLEVTSDLPNDDTMAIDLVAPRIVNTTDGFIVPCPPNGRLFQVVIGDRTGLGQRNAFPTYALTVEHRIDITRISASADWLIRRFDPVRASEAISAMPCPGGFFPDCPGDINGKIQLEFEHPIIPDCIADGPGCRMFHPFWWAKNALFELIFTSDVDQRYELFDEIGQRVGEAVPTPQEGASFVKILSLPQLPPGFYVLTITGPDGAFTLEFDEFPPDPDGDNDGIADPFDACPNSPENIDGVRDGDGCPESPGDVDGDSIPDGQDNCVNVPNQGNDGDGDGRGDECDCAINDPGTWAAPREICDLTWPSKFQLNWSPTDGGSGTVYEVIGSTLDDLPVTADGSDVCLAGNLVQPGYPDPNTPQIGGFRYNVRARNACGVSSIGGARGTSADCSTQTCSHGKCSSGPALVASCDPCVAEICAADPLCCTQQWDTSCVDRVLADCGLATCTDPNAGCAHPVCTTGPALSAGCDLQGLNCVANVCDLDPYCCLEEWDDLCRVTLQAA